MILRTISAAFVILLGTIACTTLPSPETESQTLHTPDVQTQTQDFNNAVLAINKTMHQYHYNPAELTSARYRAIEAATLELGNSSATDDEFIAGFRELWSDGPFSHVTLTKANQSAEELAAFFDQMRVGDGAVVLSWQNDTAILVVNTMMGVDTIEAIDAAYEAIVARGADKLIIDLRENEGGAFAVRPLVGHTLAQAVDAGGFVSQPWNETHNRAPTADDLKTVAPWTGWSIRAFWEDVQAAPLTRLRFEPQEPAFLGQIYVLTSKRTASAAELATAAFKSVDNATIVGEKTAGQMLSQKPYDIPGGFHLSLPIADYYSVTTGRIEGVGISPDIEIAAQDALDFALQH